MTPLYVTLMAMFIPVCKWEDEENLAKGEIVKLQLRDGIYKYFNPKIEWSFGERIVGLVDGYDWIWAYVTNGYWKVIAKTKE